jgi:hypothetical protein
MTEKSTGVTVRKSENESSKLDVQQEEGTVWLTQAQMCNLLGGDQSVISRSVSDVFKEGGFDIDASGLFVTFAADHPHDGPRTWIRGRMAPRRLRPAGFFLPFCFGRAA